MKTRAGLLLGFVSIFFISWVLRPPVASMGPLLHEIATTLGLTVLEAGILTSAPVLCFGLGAFASPWLVRRFGLHHSMLTVLIFLTASGVLRLFFGYTGLLVGTIGLGLSIAVANVLLPTVVRVDYPTRIPLVTGAYTTLLALSASFAAASAVPISDWLGGWRLALAVWLIPALLAIVFWLPQVMRQEPYIPETSETGAAERSAVVRSPITWAIVGLFGLQSLGFYAVLGWLPSVLVNSGISPSAAGGFLGLATAVGIPVGLALSAVISRFKSLAPWTVGASTSTLIGFLILQGSISDTRFVPVACVFLGLGQASSFPLALSIIGTRASTKAQTTQLSALAQGWGYLLAALGTFAVGFMFQISHSWSLGIWVLILVTALQVVAAYYSGRPGQIPAK